MSTIRAKRAAGRPAKTRTVKTTQRDAGASATAGPAALMNEHEAARRLGVSVAFLRADRFRGHVGGRTPGPPFYRIGAAVRYAVADLESWLASRRVDRRPPERA